LKAELQNTAGEAEACPFGPDDTLAEMCKKFEGYRDKIHQAKPNCGIAQVAGVSIETSNLQNIHEIVGALPLPVQRRATHRAQRAARIDRVLESFNKSLDEIRNLVAQDTQQATREAITELAQFCNACIRFH
jgi:hypothetical protein